MSKFAISLIISASLLASGCASITSTKLQPVSVTTACNTEVINDVTCTLVNDKGSWFVKTPGSVTIDPPPINRATGKLVESDIEGMVRHEEAIYG
jgi:hypothetical protein